MIRVEDILFEIKASYSSTTVSVKEAAPRKRPKNNPAPKQAENILCGDTASSSSTTVFVKKATLVH